MLRQGFRVFEFGMFSSVLLAAVLLACGGFSGLRLGISMRDRGLELRSQVADINWLRAALADSEKRCAQQAEWLNAMEAELIAIRAQEPNIDAADVPEMAMRGA